MRMKNKMNHKTEDCKKTFIEKLEGMEKSLNRIAKALELIAQKR